MRNFFVYVDSLRRKTRLCKSRKCKSS